MIIKPVHAQCLLTIAIYVYTYQYDQNKMCLLDHLIIAAFDYIHDHISACILLHCYLA